MLTRLQVEEALYGYDPSVFPRWWAMLNDWQWPEDCPIPRPGGYDDTTPDITQIRPLWDYLKEQTTDEERSRAWWIYGLGRTEAEWQAYWDDPGCPAHASVEEGVWRE